MCVVLFVGVDVGVFAIWAADADGFPAEFVGGDEIFSWVIADVGTFVRLKFPVVHDFLIREGVGLPVLLAELVGADDQGDDVFKADGFDFIFLDFKGTVCDYCLEFGVFKVGYEVLSFREEVDIGGVRAVDL